MKPEEIALCVSELGSMQYFPADVDSRSGIAKDLASMATSIDQVQWLVRTMRSKYRDWPGPAALREEFCNRYAPADGLDPCLPGGQMKQLCDHDRAKVLGASTDGQPRQIESGEIEQPVPRPVIDAVFEIQKARSEAVDFHRPATAAEIDAAPEWLKKLEGYEP